ncbi:hypothetical protein [Burkholderia ubonensis]|uniref:hypothetical protein n=1 Tax=Burkholderia ubonensis TaxID=101571 RepID=UPI00091CF0D7|nr:hypothetical protein [Burkholderia ubonensis]OJA91362.1 hypothetical protein BGV50_27455 [Burkholderia ubonensis]
MTAIVILVSTLDDLVLDACYWAFEIGRILRREKAPTVDVGMLRAMEEARATRGDEDGKVCVMRRYGESMTPHKKEYSGKINDK